MATTINEEKKLKVISRSFNVTMLLKHNYCSFNAYSSLSSVGLILYVKMKLYGLSNTQNSSIVYALQPCKE